MARGQFLNKLILHGRLQGKLECMAEMLGWAKIFPSKQNHWGKTAKMFTVSPWAQQTRRIQLMTNLSDRRIWKSQNCHATGKSGLQYRQRGQLTIFWRWHKIETDLPTTSNMHRTRETKTHPSIKYSFWANNNDSEQYVLPRQKVLIEDHSLHHPKSF